MQMAIDETKPDDYNEIKKTVEPNFSVQGLISKKNQLYE